jgi:hypothetical protein
MAILVFKLFAVIDGVLISEANLPKRSKFRNGDVGAVLANLKACPGTSVPAWDIAFDIQVKQHVRQINLPLAPFLSDQQHMESLSEPLCFSRVAPTHEPPLNWLWLYRDSLYVTERSPMSSEMPEVILRIKSLHFQGDEKLKRLKEQVANFDAIERNLKNSSARRSIPDDVKLLVWSRDGGICVRCGASKDLHFDHIIPYTRGGSDEAENLQLLCRTCNLAKSDRLV